MRISDNRVHNKFSDIVENFCEQRSLSDLYLMTTRKAFYTPSAANFSAWLWVIRASKISSISPSIKSDIL